MNEKQHFQDEVKKVVDSMCINITNHEIDALHYCLSETDEKTT